MLDPFRLLHLAGQALEGCRHRAQQQLHGHLSLASAPLYRARRLLRTGTNLLTGPQRTRLEALFANDDHLQVEATWGVYQKMVAAYRQPGRAKGKSIMRALTTPISNGVPAALSEVITLGRTLKRRAADIPAYLDHPRLLQTGGFTPHLHPQLG